MSHGEQENPGTGLRDVFDILVKSPLERLVSLTYQLGESPADNIIHALCLIILRKEAQALNKLQTLKDNCLAKHLAEKWHMSGGKVEDFGIQCGHSPEFAGESLAVLARVFKVLSEQRLCEPLLRDLAYKRALSCDNQKPSDPEDLQYDRLREEAKDVCGPQCAEWMCSPTDLKSGSYHDLHSSLNEGKTTLKVTLCQDQLERARSLPSPLQTSSLVPSYPTHLEISVPPTALFEDNKRTPETSDKSKLNAPVVGKPEAKNAPGQSQTSAAPQLEPPVLGTEKHSGMDETLAAGSSKLNSFIAQNETKTTQTSTKPNCALPTAANVCLPKMPVPKEMCESNSAEEEEEAIFYAFVILHAPEDADMAESIRKKVEMVIGFEGATFSEDFAIPGKSTLRCVEDAINNSAFTLLLLTCNFNTGMLEMKTNSALINSINKKHKCNTVIPLLPQENCIPRQSIPLVLQTIVPLNESRGFEKKLQKFLSPLRIKTQKRIWTQEQTVIRQVTRQERLKQLNLHQRQLIREYERAQSLERENLNLLMTENLRLGGGVQHGGEGRAWWPQQPNIHIENAKYIMIGNDSQMTVDMGGGGGGGAGAGEEDSTYREDKEQ